MTQIIVISETQKEILEKVCFALLNAPIKANRKQIEFDMEPYTQTQLRGLYNRVHNSMEIPK